jgi:hypothetical protein
MYEQPILTNKEQPTPTTVFEAGVGGGFNTF